MKSLLVVAGFVSACVLLGARVASADLLNPSFELPAITANGELGGTDPDGWNHTSANYNIYIANGTRVKTLFGAVAPNGSQVIEMTAGIFENELWRNTGIALQNGYTYTVSWMGSSEGSSTETVMFHSADDADASSRGTAFDWVSVATAYGAWTPLSVSTTYTGVSGKYLTVGIGAANWGAFDALSVSSVPEPSTVMLLITGLLGLLCYAWRKRK